MDIHKPKPAHSWREFLIEIGTIICGILIALGLEQLVEGLHSRHLVEEATRAMEHEVRDDDGPQAYARVAISPCLSHQLDELRDATTEQISPHDFGRLTMAYVPPARVWDEVPWKAAQASGVASSMEASQLERWSIVYGMIPYLESHQEGEMAALKRLHRTRYRVGVWTQARADEISDIIDTLDDENGSLTLNSAQQLFNMDRWGVKMAPADERALLSELRTTYGPCVVEPDRTAVRVWQSLGHTPQQKTELMRRLTGH